MNTYERVKAVMEGFGWHWRWAKGCYWVKEGATSVGWLEENPLTPDVVRAIEQGMVDKGWVVNASQYPTPSFECLIYQFRDPRIFVDSNKKDTYGMAQLECAEKVLGLEVKE